MGAGPDGDFAWVSEVGVLVGAEEDGVGFGEGGRADVVGVGDGGWCQVAEVVVDCVFSFLKGWVVWL